MSLISIIVPVYNSGLCLCRCVDSILAQSYGKFELLLIDDGSKDNSGEICDNYAIQDKRVRVFHKRNQGVSSARNLGIEKAEGEFLVFVDSDDWVDADYLMTLYPKNGEDLMSCSFVVEGDCDMNDRLLDVTYDVVEIIKGISNTDSLSVVWCKCFKRSILIDNNIRFKENIHKSEDKIFILDYLCTKINLASSVPIRQYHYVRGNSNSLSHRAEPFEQVYEVMRLILSKIEFLSQLYDVNMDDVFDEIACSLFYDSLSSIRCSKTDSLLLKFKQCIQLLSDNYVTQLLHDTDFWKRRELNTVGISIRKFKLFIVKSCNKIMMALNN